VTLNFWPAAVIVPLRGGPVVGATSNATCDVPVALAVRSVIQSASSVAVHPHMPLDARTCTVPFPPPWPKLAALSTSEKLQGAAAWVISAR
jgi:hypothetical protein